MIPIEFPEQTIVWAKNQPPYLPLPAYTNDEETISCWRLSLTERLKVLLVGRLWLRQMNFGHPLQPQAPTVDCPFVIPFRGVTSGRMSFRALFSRGKGTP